MRALAVSLALLLPQAAQAFCGFYVASGDASLFNDATQVVLMRHGTNTVLSMQNNYQGPVGDFALVIPVPEVLLEEDVKTLDRDLFDKIDRLSAPRLVEYQEACAPEYDVMAAESADGRVDDGGEDPEVTVEAEFSVAEYDIVILSTNDGAALETWLGDNAYSIPSGASAYFDPYITDGMYFFVAKVDAEKVSFEEGNAVLSPLRFHYTSETFQLPVRLGLINSKGEQDLIVYTLGVKQRYQVSNRPNTFIKTNQELVPAFDVSTFGAWYRALFREAIEETPGAAVTEYSWDASSCDPCPGPTLDATDYAYLGADVVGADLSGWVLTRLHLRYKSGELSTDLVFSEADPVVGGRERRGADGLEQGATPASINNFQGRYIIRHPLTDPAACEELDRRVWASIGAPAAAVSANTAGVAASDQAEAEGGDSGAGVIDDPDDFIVQQPASAEDAAEAAAGCAEGCAGASGASLAALALGLAHWRRRRRG